MPKLNLSYEDAVCVYLNAHVARAHRLVDASDAVAVGSNLATLPVEVIEWTADQDSPEEIAAARMRAVRDLLR